MSNATIIFLLTLCIMILICIIVYQQFVFHNGTKAKIHEISSKLKELDVYKRQEAYSEYQLRL